MPRCLETAHECLIDAHHPWSRRLPESIALVKHGAGHQPVSETECFWTTNTEGVQHSPPTTRKHSVSCR